MPPALIVGLTGGIASGKSTVAALFRELGVPVVDADLAARAVVEPGSAGLAAIRDAFSPDMIAADGSLDRGRLRAAIFADPRRRRELEDILHPLIRQWMDTRVAKAEAPYAIRMVPLLVETGQFRHVDRVLVVDVPPEIQRQRALARDGSDPGTIDGILAAQADRELRLAKAHDVISNDGPPEDLRPRVLELHHRYLQLAARLRRDQRK